MKGFEFLKITFIRNGHRDEIKLAGGRKFCMEVSDDVCSQPFEK